MITQTDLKELEKYLDSVWGLLGIDIQFTRHFLERANDPRNGKEIEFEELRKLFIETYKRYGPAFVKMGKKDAEIEGVLTSASTKLNSPFVLKWDQRNKEFDLVGKTVMRKANFVPNNNKEKKYTVESTNMTNLFNKFQVPADFAADANKILEQNYADKKAIQQETAEKANNRGKELLGLKEDVEQIDELHHTTRNSYHTKAQSGLYHANQHKDVATAKKRKKGLDILNKKFLSSFKSPKSVKEDVEQVEEGFVKNAVQNVRGLASDAGRTAQAAIDHHKDGGMKGLKRTAGNAKDIAKDIGGEVKFHAKNALNGIKKKFAREDVEQLDELSKDTLGSYIGKATAAKGYHAAGSKKSLTAAQHFLKRSKDYNPSSFMAKDNERRGYKALGNSDDEATRLNNRKKGIQLAAKKLAKEDVEQLDELSPATLHSYKAKADMNMHYNKGMADQHSESGSKAGVKHYNKAISRQKGIHQADHKLAQHADKPKGVIGKIRAKVKGIAADIHKATRTEPLPDRLKTNVQKAKEKRSYFEEVEKKNLNEISKDKLSKYYEKASDSLADAKRKRYDSEKTDVDANKTIRKRDKRTTALLKIMGKAKVNAS